MLLLAASAWAQQPEQTDEQVIDWINTNARPDNFLLATDRAAAFTEHERAMAANTAW